MYKIVVIGRGMIGSAAARHLAECNEGVACIGPDEPKDRNAHTGVFASHYDEGRMTRIVDPAPEWSMTAKRSIERYRYLERRSDVRFFTPSGYLGLGGPGQDYNANCMVTGQRHGVRPEHLYASGIRARFPFLAVDDDADGLVETGSAGHISPRRFVAAQTVLAQQAGAEMIRQAARAIRPVSAGVEIELWDGTTLRAGKALIATGAFTAACGLSPLDLGLTVYGRTTVLVRTEGAIAQALRSMPTMILSGIGAYILPPILYPDGHTYLKIGVGTDADMRLTSLHDLQHWFKGSGSHDNRLEFIALLKGLIPVLEGCQHWYTGSCAVTQTSTGLPIIDFAYDERIAVAVGGCGKGAKGADEWGRIAAGLVMKSGWTFDVSRKKLALPRVRQQKMACA